MTGLIIVRSSHLLVRRFKMKLNGSVLSLFRVFRVFSGLISQWSRLLFIACGAMLCLVCPASAQLKWDRVFVDLRASPEDEGVDIRYPFVNVGKRPITVQKLKSSCGCTTATLSKSTYAPGEHGEVVARFEIGNRVGFNDKSIVVTTDDPATPESILAFRIYIWKTVCMTPSVLFWKPTEGRVTQTVRIKVVRELSLNLVRVESAPGWQAKLLTLKPGWEYEVKVTRLDSAKETAGVVTVFADTPELDPQIFKIRLRVK